MENSFDDLKKMISRCPTSKGGRRQYPGEVRAKVLDALKTHDISVWNLAKELGISGALIKRWESELSSPSFKELQIVEKKPKTEKPASNSKLRIVSPLGFKLEGSFDEICKFWRAVHETAV